MCSGCTQIHSGRKTSDRWCASKNSQGFWAWFKLGLDVVAADASRACVKETLQYSRYINVSTDKRVEESACISGLGKARAEGIWDHSVANILIIPHLCLQGRRWFLTNLDQSSSEEWMEKLNYIRRHPELWRSHAVDDLQIAKSCVGEDANLETMPIYPGKTITAGRHSNLSLVLDFMIAWLYNKALWWIWASLHRWGNKGTERGRDRFPPKIN